jgi:UDP-3-O-[3-hydroxymyristoyl] glucosamine N-acyltransferase
MAATLGQLAARFGCELHGDPDVVVNRVGTLSHAATDAITFLANSQYRAQLKDTRAAAVILAPRDRDACPVASLVHPEPYLTYARVASALHPPAGAVGGVHASAVIAASARVALLDGVRIGARCIVHPGAVIGADGFGFAPDHGAWQKIPQLGTVVIGDDVEIGANTTIDRGTIEDTVIEDGVKLDNLVQIAHNVRLGAHTIMAAMSGVAGSTKVGKRCMIGGGVVMINALTICDDVLFTFRSIVTRSVDQPGTYSGHLPAEEAAVWRKNAARFRKLDALADRVAKAERALARLTGAEQKKTND